jgi:hypothetical protein
MVPNWVREPKTRVRFAHLGDIGQDDSLVREGIVTLYNSTPGALPLSGVILRGNLTYQDVFQETHTISWCWLDFYPGLETQAINPDIAKECSAWEADLDIIPEMNRHPPIGRPRTSPPSPQR